MTFARCLIVLAGPPCSGKSTLAAELARRHALPHLSMDATRRRIMPAAAHTRADREVAYRAMHFAAELLVQAGVAAILDAPYGHPEDRAELARIRESTAAGLRWIECRVSPETAVRRFLERGPDPIRLDLTPELVAHMVSEYRYTEAGLLLDTDQLDAAQCLARAEAWLASAPPNP